MALASYCGDLERVEMGPKPITLTNADAWKMSTLIMYPGESLVATMAVYGESRLLTCVMISDMLISNLMKGSKK